MEQIKHKAVSGAAWNVSLALANKGVTTLGQFALAWFLMPKDAGLANIALSVAAVVTIFSIAGVGDVLLQRGMYKQEAGQGLWLSLAFSCITGLVLAGIALFHPIFRTENLKGLLWLLAFASIVGFPNTVVAVDLKRVMRFKQLASAHFASGALYTCSTVYLAWLGWGPYALLAPLALRQLADLTGMVAGGARFNVAWPDLDILKKLLGPSLAVSFSSLLTALQTQAPVLVCGYALGAEATGYFSWGWALASQAVFLLAGNLREVFLAAFANLPAENGRREAAVLKAAWVMTSLLFVACGTQALLAKPLIALFLPAKWLPAVPVVIAASFGLLLQGLWVAGTAYLNACGRYRALMLISLAQAILVSVLTAVGAMWHGASGAAAGCGVATLLGGCACAWPIERDAFIQQAGKWLKPALASFAVWCLLWFASRQTNWLVAPIGAGLLFAPIAAWLWWVQDPLEFHSIWQSICRQISGLKA
jgi:O-antigen/teichoic acid export membrane protein